MKTKYKIVIVSEEVELRICYSSNTLSFSFLSSHHDFALHELWTNIFEKYELYIKTLCSIHLADFVI